MDFFDTIKRGFQRSANNLHALSENDTLIQRISDAANSIIHSYQNRGRLYIAGNGGSAADAQHFAAELVSKLNKNRTPIAAIALTVDTSLLTAIGNDYGYQYSFSRQVEGLMRKEDFLLAITTSGNSENIIEALHACRKIGAKSLVLTGRNGGKVNEFKLGDHLIIAPGETTDGIQEVHLVIYHMLAYLIEIGLIEAGHAKYL